MNKLFTKVVGLCLGLTMAVGVGTAVAFNGVHKEAVEAKAATSTATLAPSKVTSATTLTDDKSGSWNFSYVSEVSPTSESGGLHVGTNSGKATSLTVETASYNSKNIVSITAYVAAKASSNAYGYIYVGDEQVAKSSLLSNTFSSGGTALTFNNTTSKSGNIKVVVARSSSAAGALYLNKVEVEYDDSSAKELVSISVGGNMSKTDYNTAESWDPAGLTVTAHYDDSSSATVTESASWSFSPAAPALGVTSVTATATYEGKTADSDPQTVTVTEYVADVYMKVTSAPADWSGNYLLVYEPNASTAHVWTGVDGINCFKEAPIADNQIAMPYGAVSLEIASMTGGYSIKVVGGDNNGKYIYGKSGSNITNFGNNQSLNTIEINGGSAKIVSDTSTMMYNSDSGQDRFRYYKSGSSQKSVQLYKKVEAYTIANFVSDWNTATNAACSNPDADNETAITAAWPGIKANYLKLSAADQATVAAGGDPTPISLIERYDHIVARYALENFMNRSVTPSPRINVLSTMNDNGSIAIIVVVSLLSVTAIGGYFFIRRRKEN